MKTIILAICLAFFASCFDCRHPDRFRVTAKKELPLHPGSIEYTLRPLNDGDWKAINGEPNLFIMSKDKYKWDIGDEVILVKKEEK